MFTSPRGTFDILPEDQPAWRMFERRASEIAALFGYGRIDTPQFEDARVFARGIGEVTDIVEKETYTFEDRGGDLLTLRPEGTASVVRAYIQHGMHNLPQPVRTYYICPIFRYERPQSGRYRQHHQFGIEALGDAGAPVDAEVIELGWRFLESLGLTGLSLLVNSIGDAKCRPPYVSELQAHYRKHEETLCEDCIRRLVRNPLRLLDCKQESCQPVVETAPHMIDYLCGECEAHWQELNGCLAAAGLSPKIEHTLVRGFDYYTRTVFEIVPPVGGRTSTMVGGGRYDSLVEELDGRATPGMGFGMGIERALEAVRALGKATEEAAQPKVVIANLGADAALAGIAEASRLRSEGIAAVLAPAGRSLRAQMRYASSSQATHALIIGENELKSGSYVLRRMSDGSQQDVPAGSVAASVRQDR